MALGYGGGSGDGCGQWGAAGAGQEMAAGTGEEPGAACGGGRPAQACFRRVEAVPRLLLPVVAVPGLGDTMGGGGGAAEGC